VARNRKFESISLHRRVCEPPVPLETKTEVRMIRGARSRLRPAPRRLGAGVVTGAHAGRRIYCFETGVMVPNSPSVSPLGPAVK
jgi:hypothetical protein